MANLGADGKSKMTGEGVKNTEIWKAVRGYWDGSKQRDGSNGSKLLTGRFGSQPATLPCR